MMTFVWEALYWFVILGLVANFLLWPFRRRRKGCRRY